MNRETRTCQNCHNQFTIQPEDFQFYEKIQVPPPTFCPECRMIRRMAWRNEKALYRKKCDLCGKDTLSIYAPDKPYVVYCQPCWWSDNWDPGGTGRDYDFSRPFFNQLEDLIKSVPLPALWGFNNTNCDYAHLIAFSKNCYYSFSIVYSEDVYFSDHIDKSRNCLDSFRLEESELCYENVIGEKNYNSTFLVKSLASINSHFLYDCSNCQDCFMSSNLRNKRYVFRDRQLTKEEYMKSIQAAEKGKYSNQEKLKKEFEELKIKNSIHKYANILRSTNCSGEDIYESKNAKHCFAVTGVENLKFCWRIAGQMKDSYDITAGLNSELLYEACAAGSGNFMGKFYYQYKDSKNFEYCLYGASNSDLFGCVSLRNKKFQVLNKQYSEGEYRQLVPRILKHMEEMPYQGKNGRKYQYGKYLPVEICPFDYNETSAYDYFPLTQDEASAKGFSWHSLSEKEYQPTKLAKDLPDDISEVRDDILNDIIGCAHNGECDHRCSRAYKILSAELNFYRKMGLPLPRLCQNCRYYERLKYVNPLKLWHRKCTCEGDQSANKNYKNTTEHFHGSSTCPNEFETSYAPNRPEIVYCESCYNSEVV